MIFTEKKRICMNITQKHSSVKGKDDRFWLVNKVEMLLIRERALREDTASITVKTVHAMLKNNTVISEMK